MDNWNGNPQDDLKDEAKLHGVSLTDNLFTCMGEEACAKFVGAGSEQDALALPDTGLAPASKWCEHSIKIPFLALITCRYRICV